MALGDILAAIRAESERAGAEIVAAAEEEAARLVDRAREEAAREEQRLAGSLDDQARLERSRIVSRAHLKAATERRAARDQVYRAAQEGVIRRLEQLRSSPRYEEVLGALLDEALGVLPEATAVRVDPMDVGLARRLLAARSLKISVETGDCALGGVVVSADGQAVDNRILSRLDRADEHLRHIAGDLVPALRGGTA
jgi:vacuolar-type H+-ATPase subunit E/Vma4